MSPCNRSRVVRSSAVVVALTAASVGLVSGAATAAPAAPGPPAPAARPLVHRAAASGPTRAHPAAHVERTLAMGIVYFNRQETSQAAAAGTVPEACALLADAAGGPAGQAIAWGCFLHGTSIAVQAHLADARGICLKISMPWVIMPMAPYLWPSTYRGENCF
ncbi:MAG: hypothetical protein JWN46_1062 [Acidimicrobiales bacterium]|nr:hypothetical protein [Acidimicrobiales bacterium]